jgi:hypothetical protein
MANREFQNVSDKTANSKRHSTMAICAYHAPPRAKEERDLTASAKESSEIISILFISLFILGIALCAQLNCMIEKRREAYYDNNRRQQHQQYRRT